MKIKLLFQKKRKDILFIIHSIMSLLSVIIIIPFVSGTIIIGKKIVDSITLVLDNYKIKNEFNYCGVCDTWFKTLDNNLEKCKHIKEKYLHHIKNDYPDFSYDN